MLTYRGLNVCTLSFSLSLSLSFSVSVSQLLVVCISLHDSLSSCSLKRAWVDFAKSQQPTCPFLSFLSFIYLYATQYDYIYIYMYVCVYVYVCVCDRLMDTITKVMYMGKHESNKSRSKGLSKDLGVHVPPRSVHIRLGTTRAILLVQSESVPEKRAIVLSRHAITDVFRYH